jgi:small-conductance mechanosensitive channel
MRWILRLASCLLIALAAAGALAQEAAQPAGPALAELRAQLEQLPKSVQSMDDVKQLVAQVNAINGQAEKFIAARTGLLNDLNARLGELGNPPATGAPPEDPDIARQRTALLRDRNAVDADIRLARLLAVDAQQRGAELLKQRRALFEAQLTERAPSPLGREFWNDLVAAWPSDTAKVAALADELRDGAAKAAEPKYRGPILTSLALALAVAVLGSLALERLLVRLAQRMLPGGRLRRSLLVMAIVSVNVLLFGLAAQWVYSTLQAHEVLGEQANKLARAGVQSVVFIAFVVGLGRALLSNPRPSWRLPPIPDALSRRLAPFPWLTALVAFMVWAPAQVNAVVDASFAAVLATHVATALALTTLIWAMLLRLRVPPAAHAAAGDEAAMRERAEAEPPLWVGILLGATAILLIAVWVLVAIGYVALASVLSAQLTWCLIVGSAFYVLFKFADDLCMAVVSSRSNAGLRLQKSFGFAPRTLDQAAVVLSALARIALFFYMVIALIAPFGTGPEEVFQRSGKFGTGLAIGEFQVVPSSIIGALGVLIGGFVALGVFKRWLEDRYLPHTAIEPEMRSSITTLLGYAGGILVVASALSALGIGINRIAWVASALSVGIGFGLQAIVQNFISGLILLAERPVKVGDWVSLGTTEGDVRRINVRATEIQLADRSTVIVPNSEFITKTVRNMTLINAGGRVLIALPLPLDTDAERARGIMLDAFAAHPDVQSEPAPVVQLTGIEHGLLVFQAIGYVGNPRIAGNVRSDLLFSILEALRLAGLPLSVPTMVMAPPSTATVNGA